MSKVAVVIVTYNSQDTIAHCLNSLQTVGGFGEIIVIDNISTDKTTSILKSFSNVKIIKNDKNLGFGAANNVGVKNTKSQDILFLNPDTKIEAGTISGLSEYLDRNPAVAVVGPKLLSEEGAVQRELAKFPTLLSQILILLRLHRLPFFSSFAYPNFDYDSVQDVEHLMGAAIMVRRAVFEEVGGFDERFFLWFEETDLLKRIRDKGYKIVYYPKVGVTHLVGQSTKKIHWFRRQTIWNRSLLYYFGKHKTFLHIIVLLPFILLSYPAAFITNFLRK